MELKTIQALFEEKYDKKTISENIEGVNETGIGYLIPITMFTIGQIHIWHLLCTSGQKHSALGDFYDSLVENIDELSEKFIAQGGTISESEPYKYNCKYDKLEIYNYIPLKILSSLLKKILHNHQNLLLYLCCKIHIYQLLYLKLI